jgi:hypothetical protein
MQIGACLFTIYSEIEPCQRMDELQPGLRNTLSLDMRGCVWARVVRGGLLQVGQRVQILP